MNLLVYTEQITPRLTWILKEILKRRLGLDYLVVDDAEAYRHSTLPGITYAPEKVGREKELLIQPAGLLGERGIGAGVPPAVRRAGVPLLFPLESPSDVSLDLFSAAFYLMSRYEEYRPFTPDRMGRFPAEQSLAWREGWLDEPVVERWSELLRETLAERFGIRGTLRPGRFLPTFDVDQAFAYRHKTLWRLLGGALREGHLWQRWRVWTGKQEDPYDSFGEILDLHSEVKQTPVFFFHTGRWGRYDKSIPLKKRAMREVVEWCAAAAYVGIHPSLHAAKDLSCIATEKRRLEQAAGREVMMSRMHYLMLRFPDIPRALLDAGIREDHTMGFPEMPGFRAGTCREFNWYDLEKEEETSLRFVPLTVMDGALRQGLHATAGEVPAYLDHYRQRTEKYGGIFVTLWHNHTFAGAKEWAGWGEAYRRWIKKSFLT